MPKDVYLRGEITNWSCNENYHFQLIEGTGIYTLSLPLLEGEFKIADLNFDAVDYGCAPFVPGEKVEVDYDESFLCLYRTGNFRAQRLENVILEFDHTNIAKPILRIRHTETYNPPAPDLSKPSSYYLRGELHGFEWNAREEFRFKTTEVEGVYSLSVDELYGEFKITNHDWSENYGASTFTIGSPISLLSGGANINSGHIVNAKLTLDLRDRSNPFLLVDGAVCDDPTFPSGIYLIGKMYGSQGEPFSLLNSDTPPDPRSILLISLHYMNHSE